MQFQVLERDSAGLPVRCSMIRPDNWHGHLRVGPRMRAVAMASAAVYGRMTIMPNTMPIPILKVEEGLLYQNCIIHELTQQGMPEERARRFCCMTLYLTQHTSPTDIARAKGAGFVGAKFYPKNPTHGTTGSQDGVPSLLYLQEATLATMQELRFHLLLHGESTTHPDIFDLERHFVREQLRWAVDKFPDLPIVLEHVSTKEGVDFVLQAPNHVTATITPQHLWYSINSLFEGGLRPHRYCLPLYKHPEDQRALIEAATSQLNGKFCAGDDTAPHPKYGLPKQAKLTDCGCAGAYVAPVSVPMYAAAFERAGAMDARFEYFMSVNGAVARGLPVNDDKIIIERRPWKVPEEFHFGGEDVVVPLFAGEELTWQVVQS